MYSISFSVFILFEITKLLECLYVHKNEQFNISTLNVVQVAVSLHFKIITKSFYFIG